MDVITLLHKNKLMEMKKTLRLLKIKKNELVMCGNKTNSKAQF